MSFLSLFIRALIPSWRFFADIEDVPSLRTRFIDSRGETRNWYLHPSFRESPPSPRGFLEVFFNPEGNRRLADRALVQRALMRLMLLGEIEFQKSDEYQLLKKLAQEALPLETPRFQFQIWVKTKNGEDLEAFLSDIFESKRKPT